MENKKHNFRNIIFNKEKVLFETEKAVLLALDEIHNFGVPKKFAHKLTSGAFSVGIVENGDYVINRRINKIDNKTEKITIKGQGFFN